MSEDKITEYKKYTFHRATRRWNQKTADIETTEVYLIAENKCYNQAFKSPKVTNCIDNLDGINNVYFIPRTRFNRAIFKNMYPDIKIKRSAESADCIIYDEFKTPEQIGAWDQCRIEGDNIYNREYDNVGYGIGQYIYLTMHPVNKVDTFLKNVAAVKTKKPCIHIDKVFVSADTKIRQEELSTEEISKIYRQARSSDTTSQKLAADVVFSLDPKKYLPLQFFIYASLKTRTALRGPKIDMFKNYMKNINCTFRHRGYNNGGFDSDSTDKLYLFSEIIEIINGNKLFTSDMNYQSVFDLINGIDDKSGKSPTIKLKKIEFDIIGESDVTVDKNASLIDWS